MDELELLRRLEADAPRGSRAVMADAFEELETHLIAAERTNVPHRTPRRRLRVRRARWTVLVSAAALLTVLVLSDVVGVSPFRSGARAEAAVLLEQAALCTIRAADPVVSRGLYRQVVFQSVHEIEAGPETFFSIREDRTDWVPADVTGTWTEVRYPVTPTEEAWGPGASAAAAEFRRQNASQTPQVLHGPGGAFFGTDPAFAPSTVAALPRDPKELLQRIRRDVGKTGWSSDGASFNRIAELLSSGVAPAPVRAALYRAAALIPDVTLVAHATTLRGIDGVAVGRVEPGNGIRLDLVIDPDSGELIGQREVTTHPVDAFEAGTTTSWSSTTTTVVDRVPAEYRP